MNDLERAPGGLVRARRRSLPMGFSLLLMALLIPARFSFPATNASARIPGKTLDEEFWQRLSSDSESVRYLALGEFLPWGNSLVPEILLALPETGKRPWAIFLLGLVGDEAARTAVKEIYQKSNRDEDKYLAIFSLAMELKAKRRLQPKGKGSGPLFPADAPEFSGEVFNTIQFLIDNLDSPDAIILAQSVPGNFPFLCSLFTKMISHHVFHGLFSPAGPADYSSISPLLTEALGNRDWRIRLMACEGLSFSEFTAAIKPLACLLTDPEWQVRRAAAATLGAFKNEEAVPDLTAALKNADAFAREDLVKALGKIGGKLAVKTLSERFQEDEDKDVRQEALFCLANISKKNRDGELIRIIAGRAGKEKNEEVLRKIERVLGELDPQLSKTFTAPGE